jgi:hypothetical protein
MSTPCAAGEKNSKTGADALDSHDILWFKSVTPAKYGNTTVQSTLKIRTSNHFRYINLTIQQPRKLKNEEFGSSSFPDDGSGPFTPLEKRYHGS